MAGPQDTNTCPVLYSAFSTPLVVEAAKAEAAVSNVVEVAQAEVVEGLPIEGLVVFGAIHARPGGPQEAIADRPAKCCARQSWRWTQVEANVVASARGVRYVFWQLLRALHFLRMHAKL